MDRWSLGTFRSGSPSGPWNRRTGGRSACSFSVFYSSAVHARWLDARREAGGPGPWRGIGALHLLAR